MIVIVDMDSSPYAEVRIRHIYMFDISAYLWSHTTMSLIPRSVI